MKTLYYILMYIYILYSVIRCDYIVGLIYLLFRPLPDQDYLASFLVLLIYLPCVFDYGRLLLVRARVRRTRLVAVLVGWLGDWLAGWLRRLLVLGCIGYILQCKAFLIREPATRDC